MVERNYEYFFYFNKIRRIKTEVRGMNDKLVREKVEEEMSDICSSSSSRMLQVIEIEILLDIRNLLKKRLGV